LDSKLCIALSPAAVCTFLLWSSHRQP